MIEAAPTAAAGARRGDPLDRRGRRRGAARAARARGRRDPADGALRGAPRPRARGGGGDRAGRGRRPPSPGGRDHRRGGARLRGRRPRPRRGGRVYSPTRRREGLAPPVGVPARYGLRRDFAAAPWSEDVEVHFGDRAEAYVWPAGPPRGSGSPSCTGRGGSTPPPRALPGGGAEGGGRRGGIRAARRRPVRPGGPARVRIGWSCSATRRATSTLLRERARSGSAAYAGAELAALLPAALAAGASAAALRPYEAAWRRRFLPYAAWTRLLLALSRRPALRRRVLALAAARPRPFER